ncbi:hypothetical protein [Bosea sp. (in: a-proteobacteria)]|uniref:hypothetical protein n=1 Tax=Bosea sp. (in: a-proteobacteria) TaxID=1871050 RepID=UPI0027343F2F|nr:hypothetical protein [Bosea sp. (in: a-proteobacteria)]MDP3410332.1 hypothetical protein [Bosea sp. (in: a-proteobacteria)]
MTTARADLITIGGSWSPNDEMPAVSAFGTGATLANVAGDAELVASAADLDRRYLVHAEGGQIWVSIAGAASTEPRGFLASGKSVLINLRRGQSIRVAAANLT